MCIILFFCSRSSPFLFFLLKKRAELEMAYPESNHSWITQELRRQWTAFTDDGRNVYKTMADNYVQRYEQVGFEYLSSSSRLMITFNNSARMLEEI
jgi:hypothetical protein